MKRWDCDCTPLILCKMRYRTHAEEHGLRGHWIRFDAGAFAERCNLSTVLVVMVVTRGKLRPAKLSRHGCISQDQPLCFVWLIFHVFWRQTCLVSAFEVSPLIKMWIELKRMASKSLYCRNSIRAWQTDQIKEEHWLLCGLRLGEPGFWPRPHRRCCRG